MGYSSPFSCQIGHMTTLFTSLFLLAINSKDVFWKWWSFRDFFAFHLTRSYRCILSHTNTPTVSEISSLQCRRQILPVHCLTLQNFDRPNMKRYNMTPQPHALVAPKLQDAFRNITSEQFQTPSSISTPLKQYTFWESVNRENINVLNHIFLFNSVNIKATEEMEK